MTGASVRAGGAYIELGIKSRLDKGLKDAEKQLKRGGAKLTKLGGVLVAGSAGLLAVPIKAASDMQETMGKFEAVFGESAAALEKWADKTAASLGITEQAMASMLSGVQDLLVPMGVLPSVAEDMSKQMSVLAVDLGSFNNMDSADVMRDLMAAMTGSSETMKKYGVIVDAAAVKQELLNRGLDPKTADNAAKAQARLAIIMRSTTAAQGDAIRTSGSFANQTKRLKAIILDTAAALGGPIIDDLASMVQLAGKGAAYVKDFVQENQGLVRVVGLATVAVGGIGAGLMAAGGAMSLAGVALGGIKLGLLSLASPIGLATAGIAGLGYAFFRHTELGKQTLNELIGRFTPLVSAAKNAVSQISAALSAGDMETAWNLTLDLIELAWLDLTDEVRTAWESAMDAIFNAGSHTAKAIGQVFQALAGYLDGMLSGYETWYNSLSGKVADSLTEMGGTRVIGGNSGTAGEGAFASQLGGTKGALKGAIDSIDRFGREMERTAEGQIDQRRQDRAAARRARQAQADALRAQFGSAAATPQEAAKNAAKQAEKQSGKTGGGAIDRLIAGLRSAAKSAGSKSGLEAGSGQSSGTFSAFAASLAGGPQVRMLSLTQSIEMSNKQMAVGIRGIASLLERGKGGIQAVGNVGGTAGSFLGTFGSLGSADPLVKQLVTIGKQQLKSIEKGAKAKFG